MPANDNNLQNKQRIKAFATLIKYSLPLSLDSVKQRCTTFGTTIYNIWKIDLQHLEQRSTAFGTTFGI